jgi:hypothetical protein
MRMIPDNAWLSVNLRRSQKPIPSTAAIALQHNFSVRQGRRLEIRIEK